ncbi:dephospho-CoA kinase [Enterococcus asini]|uniref:dephospho-CoA kinase n=1 Tax=Enterococcus asini TaxID=57732 RepID=UPI00288D8036|nr:dephospho-CoA kinase [Enterococcus asini]MDT2756925.1 dephospho-CoA kinase [Enterococcus asini]
MAFVLGVTGGIATGKSTVVNFFKAQGFPVVDGDQIARAIVEPKMPALTDLTKAFGLEILKEGQLDRQKLGEIVFGDAKKRQQMDQILDGYLRKEITDQIKEASKTAPLVIADIPLLYEADYGQYMDQVAVVYIPEELQQKRLMERDHLTSAEAKKRMDSQLSIEEKRQRADILFDNQGTIDKTKEQVQSWLDQQGFTKNHEKING